MATTRLAIRQSVAMNVKDDLTITVTSVAGNSVTSSDLAHIAGGELNDAVLYVYSGTGVGQERVVKTHTQASDLSASSLEPYVPWGTAPVAGSLIEVHRPELWRPSQYNEAIRRTFEHARGYWLEDAYSETLTMTANVDEYSLPASWRVIADVWVKPTGVTRWKLVPFDKWDVVRGARKLKVDLDYVSAGAAVRLNGQVDAEPPAADTTSFDLPEAYCIAKATAHILRMKPGGPLTDVENRDRWALAWDAEATKELPRIQPIPGARIVDVPR